MAESEDKKAKRRDYRKKFRESIGDYNREYYAKNRQSISARVKAYRSEDRKLNPEKYIARQDKVRGSSCRAYCLRHKYGMEHEDYVSMLDSQGGACAICGTSNPGRQGVSFCVDHCHDTGKVRGLLCVRCNAGLGQFKDDVNRLENAIEYLKKSKYQGSD